MKQRRIIKIFLHFSMKSDNFSCSKRKATLSTDNFSMLTILKTSTPNRRMSPGSQVKLASFQKKGYKMPSCTCTYDTSKKTLPLVAIVNHNCNSSSSTNNTVLVADESRHPTNQIIRVLVKSHKAVINKTKTHKTASSNIVLCRYCE
jgi:hypothetical protein